MISGVVFDIDDTLYYEREYVRSGFSCIAALCGRSELETRALADWLDAAFDLGVRGDTFDRLLAKFPAVAKRVSAATLVDAYRRHPPVIGLAPGIEALLNGLRDRRVRLGILSDGPEIAQAAKAEALGLDRWFDTIVLTASLGPAAAKPATAGFEAIAGEWGIPHCEMSYIADNPEKDFVGPRALGWLTVRLRQPEQLRYTLEPAGADFGADLEIRAPVDLLSCLGF